MPKYEVVYFQKSENDCPIEAFLDSIPPKAAAKCAAYMDLLEEHGFFLPAQYSKKVGGDVWELRPEFGGVEYRLLYGRVPDRFFVVAHAITKKGRKLDPRDIIQAEERIREVRDYYASSDREDPPPIRPR